MQQTFDLTRTLRDVFDELYKPVRLRGKTRHTVYQYERYLKQFDEFLNRSATLADFNDVTMSKHLDWVQHSNHRLYTRPRTPRTVNNIRSYLLAYWRWCARKGLTPVWPDVEPLVASEKIPRAYTAEQLVKLFDAIRKEPGTIGGAPASAWFDALYRVAYCTGERGGALLKTEWDDYNRATGLLCIPAEKRKGKFKPGVYELTPDAMEAVEKIYRPQNALIWTMDCHPATYYNRSRRLHKRAGIQQGGIQRMRRTHASMIEAHGGDGTRALMHSNRAITERYYLDPALIDRKPEAAHLPTLGSIVQGGAQ